MKNHVTTLDQSQKLKEIGVPQNGKYAWFNSDEWGIELWECSYCMENLRYGVVKIARALLLTELIEILGDKFETLERVEGWRGITTVLPTKEKFKTPYRALSGLVSNPIEAVYRLILKLHAEGVLQFNKQEDV